MYFHPCCDFIFICIRLHGLEIHFYLSHLCFVTFVFVSLSLFLAHFISFLYLVLFLIRVFISHFFCSGCSVHLMVIARIPCPRKDFPPPFPRCLGGSSHRRGWPYNYSDGTGVLPELPRSGRTARVPRNPTLARRMPWSRLRSCGPTPRWSR